MARVRAVEVGFGTEVGFRLEPGTEDEARAIAGRLALAADGCRRHVLFLDGSGVYGCLAEWDREEDARAFLTRPALLAELAALAERCERAPHTRLYAMEEQPAP
jgi:hypothetical protein